MSLRASVLGLTLIAAFGMLMGCREEALNSPYPNGDAKANVLYSFFSERPNHLDPARSYATNETVFTAQIYEPPLQYAYLIRPLKLIPLTATSLPTVRYYNAEGEEIKGAHYLQKVSRSVYQIPIQPHIRYAPHPCFAKDGEGQYRYHHLNPHRLEGKHKLSDFKFWGSRELTAEDYVYEIKRLADPRVHSPIMGVMGAHIEGFKQFSAELRKKIKSDPNLSLRDVNFPGARVVDRYTYEVSLTGDYPQFVYWLAMPFFAPMPWEAITFYEQPMMREKNIVLDWYPVGTGPFYLAVNDPNRKMVMRRNPLFRGEFYPSEGEAGDREKGLLVNAGQVMPFIDKAVFMLEKETIPQWNKFMQGYYDRAGISADNFDQAIEISENAVKVSPVLQKKDVRLQTYVGASSFYWGFNMKDPLVGGKSSRAKKLRQAISIALNTEEFISIFMNGRGIPAQGPIPPDIFGYEKGAMAINPIVYTWQEGVPKRRSIDRAKALLKAAGYRHGIDVKTGQPIIIHFDLVASDAANDSARMAWLRKQLGQLGIQVHIRATQYNRFQRKMRRGDAQIFFWGWQADYPDPENFLFLLYGPNGKVDHGGENAANYDNPTYDALFRKMRNMPNGPERLKIIREMLAIVREDAPWIWGFHPKNFALSHSWNSVTKPNDIANNTLKYTKIDGKLRAHQREVWNRPLIWPLNIVLFTVLLILAPYFYGAYQRHYFKRFKRLPYDPPNREEN